MSVGWMGVASLDREVDVRRATSSGLVRGGPTLAHRFTKLKFPLLLEQNSGKCSNE